MLKRLITTTALAGLLALPAVAQQQQTQDDAQAAPAQTQSQTQPLANSQSQGEAGMQEIQASNLIGMRLYIQRGQGAEQTGQQGSAQTGQQGSEQAQTQDRPAGSTAEGQSEQVVEGQAPQAAPEAQGSEMAELEQGVSGVPEDWTMAGEIDDVLLSQDGQVQSLVVDTGGFLGMNESTRRIDISQVRFVPDRDRDGEFYAVYTGDRTMLEGSERFDEASVGEGMVRGTETWAADIEGTEADVDLSAITSDELVGTAVYGADRNWVGEIGEIALSEDGNVEAVIIDVGGFLGIGEKPVALSMDQVQIRRGEGGLFGDDLRVYVDATEEELESMEAWDERG